MRVRIPAAWFVVVLSAVGGASQTLTLKEIQKDLEKRLFKHTPHVKLARFSGCLLKMSAQVPSDGKANPMGGQMPSVTPREAIFTSAVGGTSNIVEFGIDLAEVSSSSVVLKSTENPKYTNLSLEAAKDGAVSRVWQGKKKNVGGLDILVNQKEGTAIADSFRQIIKLCKK